MLADSITLKKGNLHLVNFYSTLAYKILLLWKKFSIKRLALPCQKIIKNCFFSPSVAFSRNFTSSQRNDHLRSYCKRGLKMHKNVRGFLLCLLLLGFCFPASAELLAGVEHNPSESETRAKARAWLSEHIGVDLTWPTAQDPKLKIAPLVRGDDDKKIVPYIGAEFSLQGRQLTSPQLIAGLEVNLTENRTWRLAVDLSASSSDAAATVSVLVDLDSLLAPPAPEEPPKPQQPPPKPKEPPKKPQEPWNQEDLMLLARLISAEARGEPYLGQVAVGAVVLNRVKSPLFPNSIRAVIYQPGQFTPVSNGTINRKPTESAIRAAKAALSGQDPSRGALFFYNPKLSSRAGLQFFQSRQVTVRIGNHVFTK